VNGPIGVAGAGTMGAGIAQLACLAGFETVLHDPDAKALERGHRRVRGDLERGVQRGRWGAGEAELAATRLTEARALEGLAPCELVIEAAPEELALKRDLFARLESACAPTAVLATNTSSLPVTEIAAGTARPERTCGMHFFNPPILMKLVEVVAGADSGESALAVAVAVAERMGRTVIRCPDSPGFVVNRCNRPFTLESLRILEAGIASAAEIDRAIREQGGFPMGPFELIDLIGVDVNLEVARSFHRQRPEPRWQPSALQERMVAAGRLGRKAGRGFYEYDERERPVGSAAPTLDSALGRQVLERVVAQLVNEACFATEEGVAAPAEIDTAVKLGLNHPRGPFEWARELGAERVEAILDALGAEDGPRYRVAPYLRRLAARGQPS
jgi:3-hydroxybutyryl-CoA dehydrogenase